MCPIFGRNDTAKYAPYAVNWKELCCKKPADLLRPLNSVAVFKKSKGTRSGSSNPQQSREEHLKSYFALKKRKMKHKQIYQMKSIDTGYTASQLRKAKSAVFLGHLWRRLHWVKHEGCVILHTYYFFMTNTSTSTQDKSTAKAHRAKPYALLRFFFGG